MKVPTPLGADSPGLDGPTELRGNRRRRFQRALLAWYTPSARPLRIRTTREPWAILVSEVMAQQTQISRVDEAWAMFMESFPTPRALAEATPAEVLRAWAGLGYNRRAINLQRAALVIEAKHAGAVPTYIVDLEALPGVGPYTARAVAAIAFGRPVAAVDTNVRRVVTRLAGRPMAASKLQMEADALVDETDPATWTHACMELGAVVCVARAPRCDACPVARWCDSAARVVSAERGSRAASVPFERTTRWLRGRIVAQLRELDDDAWMELPDVIGEHGSGQIASAVNGLEEDGLLERSLDGLVRLPSNAT